MGFQGYAWEVWCGLEGVRAWVFDYLFWDFCAGWRRWIQLSMGAVFLGFVFDSLLSPLWLVGFGYV